MAPPPDVHAALLSLLDQQGRDYRVIEHAPATTCETVAAARGTPLREGAKALLCKVGRGEAGGFRLYVLPSSARLSTPRLRVAAGTRHFRFATREELLEATGLEPGAVPPFGSLFGVPTVCDPSLRLRDRIVFNAGRHDISVQLALVDYLAVEQPAFAEVAEEG